MTCLPPCPQWPPITHTIGTVCELSTTTSISHSLNQHDSEYELTVRQEPKQARMCGVGGKGPFSLYHSMRFSSLSHLHTFLWSDIQPTAVQSIHHPLSNSGSSILLPRRDVMRRPLHARIRLLQLPVLVLCQGGRALFLLVFAPLMRPVQKSQSDRRRRHEFICLVWIRPELPSKPVLLYVCELGEARR
jgi:hypothetical protein